MNLKQALQAVKKSMSILTKAMNQLPQDKRVILAVRVNQVLYKHSMKDKTLQQLTQFKKQLDFNLNFVKLSHPNLDYTTPVQPTQPKSQNTQNTQTNQSTQNQQKQQQHKFNLVTEQKYQIQRLKNDTFDTQLQRQKNIRTQVQFTNWFAGNADPQLVKRHKQLLERQYFMGQFWKDKEKPKSYIKQYMATLIAEKQANNQYPKKQKELKDFKPYDVDKSERVWETVKR